MGSKFMLEPATFAKATEIGAAPDDPMTQGKQPPVDGAQLLDGMDSYIAGRFGVLGEVHPDVVIGAAAFINPDALGAAWERITHCVNPRAVSEIYYADCAADWGRANFEDTPELRRFCELAETVVGSASPVGAPIFAGWRAISRPDDAPGAAELLLHILRELRFARHAVAVTANEMSPLEAVLTKGGEGNAQMFQWPEPYPDVSGLDDKRAQIEQLTHRLSAQDYEALDPDECQEFADLVAGLET